MSDVREDTISDQVVYRQHEGTVTMEYAFAKSGRANKGSSSIEANLLFEVLVELRKLNSCIQNDDQPAYGPFLRFKEMA